MQLTFALSALLAATSAKTLSDAMAAGVSNPTIPELAGSTGLFGRKLARVDLGGRKLGDDSWQPDNDKCLIERYHDKCNACMCRDTGTMWCNQSVNPDPAFMDKDGRGSNGCQEKKQWGETCGQSWECKSGLYCGDQQKGDKVVCRFAD
jgi:hypothetical protein